MAPGREREEKNAMGEQRVDNPRRKLMGNLVKGVSAALLFRLSPAAASEKMTQQQAEYQDKPNGIYSCGMCTLFERPNACKVVEGEISKDGWCKAFAMAD
jgi:hypothetical protein